MPCFEPAYLRAYRSSALKEKIRRAETALSNCCLCPRQCGADRTAGEIGYCKTAAQAVVASYDAHFGEESPLAGRHGSGTIFFTHCNLLCTFCQNYDISHLGAGTPVTSQQLADFMLQLQKQGCHNINFVSPSHVVPQILAALLLAVEGGLNIPLVYNTGGYDRVETLNLLDGIIDIYMPDFKFWNADIASKTCNAPDYQQIACQALVEMHKQVGELALDEQGIARRGVLLRHLVLPEGLAGTREIMHFIANRISKNTYVNIMGQYRPCGQAGQHPQLDRSITKEEYTQAVHLAKEQGIHRLDRRKRVFMLC
jgi:putative pyruvate formate lyase activating enzyme